MEPLRQWVCDVCGQIINTPEEGYIIWRENDEQQIDDMLIIHANRRVEGRRNCDRDDYRFSMDLPYFLGDDGLVKLLALVDPGPRHTPEYRNHIANMRLFIEVFRRLHIPYYEEARIYWNIAEQDGYFDDANEVWMYLPSTLRELVERYRD